MIYIYKLLLLLCLLLSIQSCGSNEVDIKNIVSGSGEELRMESSNEGWWNTSDTLMNDSFR